MLSKPLNVRWQQRRHVDVERQESRIAFAYRCDWSMQAGGSGIRMRQRLPIEDSGQRPQTRVVTASGAASAGIISVELADDLL
jgi:hypothetical protein